VCHRALTIAALVAQMSCTPCRYMPEVLKAARARHAHEQLASIRRTGCFGWCPVYTLRVFRDGDVEFEGEAFVQVIGRATGHLSDAELDALDDLFLRNGYLDLDSSYDSPDATDFPSADTSYSPGGCTRSVSHYLGDFGAPRVLLAIERGIDSIAHVEQWIGRGARRPDRL
jgi:hypothetical protein